MKNSNENNDNNNDNDNDNIFSGTYAATEKYAPFTYLCISVTFIQGSYKNLCVVFQTFPG